MSKVCDALPPQMLYASTVEFLFLSGSMTVHPFVQVMFCVFPSTRTSEYGPKLLSGWMVTIPWYLVPLSILFWSMLTTYFQFVSNSNPRSINESCFPPAVMVTLYGDGCSYTKLRGRSRVFCANTCDMSGITIDVRCACKFITPVPVAELSFPYMSCSTIPAKILSLSWMTLVRIKSCSYVAFSE